MITTPIFTRLLDTDEYGRFGEWNSWYGIIAILISFQLTAGVHTQGLIKFSDERKVFTSSLQGLTTVSVLVWLCIYLSFNVFWNNLLSLNTIQILSMIVMVWTTSIFGFWANEQRVNYNYRLLVVITIGVSIAKPILGVLLVTNCDDKVTARIVGLVLVELIFYFWMFIVQARNGKVFFSKRFWNYALMFNIPLIPHYLSQTVLNSADRIMIGRMVGDNEAGIYSLAYSLSLLMTMVNVALSQTINPWIYQKIKDKKEAEIAPIAYLTIGVVAVANLLLIVFAPEIVRVFAPKTYYNAIWIIPPVSLSVILMFCYDLFAKFAFYYEKTKLIMIASTIGAGLNIILNFIFIRVFGYIAAGYTTLICYICYCIGHYFIMKRVCKTNCDCNPYNTRKLILIILTSIICGLSIMITYNHPFVRYGIMILCVFTVLLFRKKINEKICYIFSLNKK